jgi:penicillin amidase
MSVSSMIRRGLIWTALGFGVLVSLLIICAVVGVGWLSTSAVSPSGVRRVAGLHGNATISRDRFGVPQIEAASEEDAYFALGYAEAQDRLWQLETLRRVSQGRLAETIGSDGLELDTLIRALEVEDLAKATLAGFSPRTRKTVEAFVAGLNAELAERQGAPPPEALALGVKIVPWTAVDVARLSGLVLLGEGSWRDQLLRLKLSAHLSCAAIHDLYPPQFDPSAVSYPEAPAGKASAKSDTCGALPAGVARGDLAKSGALAAMIGALKPASNTFAVAGARTRSGAALLANDPHGGFTAPADYYLARLDAPGFTLAGATLAGAPGMAAGHNGRIAWGVTDMMADQSDLFVEKLDPGRPDRYLTPNGSQAFEARTFDIAVKGKDRPTRVTIRFTRHGPVVSDFLAEAKDALDPKAGVALALSLVRPPNGAPLLNALDGFAHATDWSSFKAATQDFLYQQNFSYAGPGGEVGLVSVALLPKRGKGDGFMPVPGWSEDYDWQALSPAAERPFVVRPAEGFVANANNALTPNADSAAALWNHPPPYRIQRIRQRLAAATAWDAAKLATVQLDTRSLQAIELKARLAGAVGKTAASREALALLAHWDGDMAAGRPEPLIYTAWLDDLTAALLKAKLGPSFTAYLGNERIPPYARLLDHPRDWCGGESCRGVVEQALERAVARLSAAYGPDPAKWRWGAAHRARFANQLLQGLGPVGEALSPNAEVGGDAATIAAAQPHLAGASRYDADYGPRYRQIIDLAELDASRFMIAPGVSENLFSASFKSLAGAWSRGEYLSLPRHRPAGTVRSVLTLQPASSGK